MAVTGNACRFLILVGFMTFDLSACTTLQGSTISGRQAPRTLDLVQLRRNQDQLDGKIVVVSGYLYGEPLAANAFLLSSAYELEDDGTRRCDGRDGRQIGVEFRKGRSPKRWRFTNHDAPEAESRRVVMVGRFEKEKVEIEVNGPIIEFDGTLQDARILSYEDSWCVTY